MVHFPAQQLSTQHVHVHVFSITISAAVAGTVSPAIGPAKPGAQQKGPAPHNKKKTAADLAGTEVYKVIQNSSPISALHEYCKKCK